MVGPMAVSFLASHVSWGGLGESLLPNGWSRGGLLISVADIGSLPGSSALAGLISRKAAGGTDWRVLGCWSKGVAIRVGSWPGEAGWGRRSRPGVQ